MAYSIWPGSNHTPYAIGHSRVSEQWSHRFHGFLGWDDGNDLELHQVLPLDHPLLEQARVGALHELKAAVEIRLDPAPHIGQPLGRHAPLLPEPTIHRHGIPVLEPLDQHEEHRPPASPGSDTRERRARRRAAAPPAPPRRRRRSEEHTSELQSPTKLVCGLLLEKKKNRCFSSYRHCHHSCHTRYRCCGSGD